MKQRNLKYDFIKSIAILGVILGHSLSLVLTRRAEMQLLADYLTVVFRVVVPAFLFVSGVLHKKGLSFAQILMRIKRILSPYVFFAVIMTVIYIALGDHTFLSRYIVRFISCEVHPVYYYVFVMIECLFIAFLFEKICGYRKMLIPLYLVVLIYSIISANFSKEILCALNISNNMVDFITYRNPFLWMHYYLLGMIFKEYNLEKFIVSNKYVVRIFYVSLVLTYMVFRYFHIGDLDGLNSVITMIVCLAGIMMLLTIEVSSEKWIYLSSKSYTIYLAHVPFYYFVSLLWDRYTGISIPVMVVSNMVILGGGAMLVCVLGKMILKDKSYYFIGS
ncbi:MAG: acyltransferase family protein [Intestinibacter sp.]|uniref:acyltransferase family protein n=2 Tax=Intestinibacter sp. TaxID=1965304 RepID=UPI002A83B50B|nr:acyltransferase family protein [Intestinibacter sp.]MDY4574250.1 acyltransferase family protein [Intestinibacter sp.]